MYQVPVAYKARKAVTILGVAYTKGQLVPADVVRKVKVGPLISRGILLPQPDPHFRKGYDGPDPMVTYVPPKALPIATANKATGTLNASINVRTVTFSTDFSGPMFFDFGDNVTGSYPNGNVVHTYPSAATYSASAESATTRGTKSVVIASLAADEESVVAESSEDYSDYPVDGTIPDVKAWVGDDPARAEYATEQENLRDTPRVTLLDYLTTVGA